MDAVFTGEGSAVPRGRDLLPQSLPAQIHRVSAAPGIYQTVRYSLTHITYSLREKERERNSVSVNKS